MNTESWDKVDTVVLGGGISGLYLALLLEKSGHRVVVLEKDAVLGGLLRTVECQGYYFDMGGHRLVFSKTKELFLFLEEIGFNRPIIKHRRQARIIVEKRFLHYPPVLADAFWFPPRVWKAVAWDFLMGRRRFLSPNTFEEWVCRHYGETIYHLIFKDYTRKVWGVECSAFSPEFLRQRVGKVHLLPYLLGRQGVMSKDARSVFHYPSLGMSEVVDSVIARLGDNVSILRSSEVLGVRPEGGGARIQYRSGSLDAREIVAGHVISTIPVPSLFKILNDPVLDRYLPSYQSRNLVLLNLILKDSSKVPRFHWVYFPQKDVIFSRAFIPRVWSEKMAPGQGCSLSFEVICGEELFRLPDIELQERLLRDIEKTEMGISLMDIRSAFLTRYEHAYPVVCDAAAIEAGKRTASERFPFLKFAGRAGSHAYYDIENCVHSVRSVVKELTNLP